MKKPLILLLKCTFAIAALYIVYLKADLKEVLIHIKTIKLPYILLCFLILNGAQIVSAFRMRYYFEASGLRCSPYFSIALYYIGMFFNTVLPGGIGGDGYKIWMMSRLEKFPKMTSLRLMLSNRANGLFLLLLFTLGMTFFSHSLMSLPYASLVLTLSIILLIAGYFLSTRWLLKEKASLALGAMKYSFIIQGCCLISAIFLFIGMGLDFSQKELYIDYLILFMISSVVSILPVSMGGVGLREVTFLYGTQHFNLDSSFGVAFSLVYFAINMVLSLLGLLFISQLKTIHQNQKHKSVTLW